MQGCVSFLGQANGLGPPTNVSAINPLPVAVISSSSGSGAVDETPIAAGGTAQNLFGGATPTNGYEIINNSTTEILYFREANDAAVGGATSTAIQPGASYYTASGYKPTGRVSVIAATTAHPLIGRRW